MVRIGAFNIEPYSPLKPTKVGFIFIGPNYLSRAEDHAAVIVKSSKLGQRLGLKVGFKKLGLEPKFLNCGHCKIVISSDFPFYRKVCLLKKE